MGYGFFSFFALRVDQSVADWDMLELVDEVAAAKHAAALSSLHREVSRVEVWRAAQLCFAIPTESQER